MNNLSAEARLEKLLAQNAKSQPFYPFVRDDRLTLQQVDLDPVADLHTRELRITSQLEKIAKNAIKERLGWKPPKIKSEVTKQHIERYQLSLLQPVIIGDKEYKYHPSSLTLDKVEYPDPPREILTAAQKDNIEGEIGGLVDAIERRRALQADLRTEIEQNVLVYNAAKPANQVGKFDGKERQKGETKKEFAARKAQEEKAKRLETDFVDTQAKLEKQIEEIKGEIAQIETERTERRARLDKSKAAEADYAAAVQQIDAENAQRLEAYKADMNRLNRGAFNLQQEEGETDDEFRQRLVETGQAAWDPKDLAAASASYFRSILREKLLELTRDYQLINETLKFLTDDEVGEVEINFPPIKEKFLQQFGFDNPYLKVTDMGTFLRKMVDTILKEKKDEGLGGILINKKNEGVIPQAVVVSGPSDVTMTEKKFDETVKDSLSDWLEARKFVAPFNQIGEDGDTIYESIKRKIRRARDREDYKDIFKEYRILVPNDAEGEVVFGRGMKAIKHELPNLIEFGKVKISPRKLYYNNTLVIKHKTGNSLSGLPNTRVSDKFSDIVLGLLQGRQPTVSDFKALDVNEKGLYDALIRTAGLHKEIENNFENDTKQMMKDRLELLEGQIGAGNDNPAIKKELYGLVHKMAACGMVGYGDGRRYLKSVLGK